MILTGYTRPSKAASRYFSQGCLRTTSEILPTYTFDLDQGIPVADEVDSLFTMPTPSRTPPQPADVQSKALSNFLTLHRRNEQGRVGLHELYTHLVEFSTNCTGSRFIQERLKTASEAEKMAVFVELWPCLMNLCHDNFGNYVVQVIVEFGSAQQQNAIALAMRNNMLELTQGQYSCRVVQKVFEKVPAAATNVLMWELNRHVMDCTLSQNGNHVVQQIIQLGPDDIVRDLVHKLSHGILDLCHNQFGCRVMQAALKRGEAAFRHYIANLAAQNAQDLALDAFGNYVLQSVLEFEDKSSPAHRCILDDVLEHVGCYSLHEKASNVVDKSIKDSHPEFKERLLRTIVTAPDGLLPRMCSNKYGNFVVQNLLKGLSKAQQSGFVDALRPAVARARQSAPPEEQRYINPVEKTLGEVEHLLGRSRFSRQHQHQHQHQQHPQYQQFQHQHQHHQMHFLPPPPPPSSRHMAVNGFDFSRGLLRTPPTGPANMAMSPATLNNNNIINNNTGIRHQGPRRMAERPQSLDQVSPSSSGASSRARASLVSGASNDVTGELASYLQSHTYLNSVNGSAFPAASPLPPAPPARSGSGSRPAHKASSSSTTNPFASPRAVAAGPAYSLNAAAEHAPASAVPRSSPNGAAGLSPNGVVGAAGMPSGGGRADGSFSSSSSRTVVPDTSSRRSSTMSWDQTAAAPPPNAAATARPAAAAAADPTAYSLHGLNGWNFRQEAPTKRPANRSHWGSNGNAFNPDSPPFEPGWGSKKVNNDAGSPYSKL